MDEFGSFFYHSVLNYETVKDVINFVKHVMYQLGLILMWMLLEETIYSFGQKAVCTVSSEFAFTGKFP